MDELTSLARAAGRGDRAALARLVQQTQGDVWRLCAYLVDPASADDLAQDTYLRAIPALRKFRGDAPVRSWLLAIARRACAAEIGARSGTGGWPPASRPCAAGPWASRRPSQAPRPRPTSCWPRWPRTGGRRSC